MKKPILITSVLLVSTLFLILSCEKNIPNSCDVSNPLDMKWLKTETDLMKSYKYSYYMMADYNGESVFYNHNCDPVANYVSIVKNCKGEVLGNYWDFQDQFTNAQVIWKADDFACGD